MRRRSLILGSLMFMLAPAAARAGVKDFDPQAFAAAQEAGRGIVVAVNATW